MVTSTPFYDPEGTVHVLKAPGVRVVASPEAIDAAEWQDTGSGPDEFEPLVLRFAPDEAFAVGATGVHIDDPHAIAETETAVMALMFPVDEFIVVRRPADRVAGPGRATGLPQGSIAGVPAKLYVDPTGAATVFVMASYLDDLMARLPVPQ